MPDPEADTEGFNNGDGQEYTTNEIAIYLDNKLKIINEIIQKEQKRVELLYNYKNSIISEIINGRMRVLN